MKPPILVGIGIGVVILAAVLVAPYLGAGQAKDIAQAREQAELARRLLYRYDQRLPHLERLSDAADLKEAKLGQIFDKTQEGLRDDAQKDAQRLSRMQAQARTAGLSAPTVDTLPRDAAGLRKALDKYQSLLKVNDGLLSEAVQQARQARNGPGGEVPDVPPISGVAEYVRASVLLGESEASRVEQQELQARLVQLGGRWKEFQAQEDYLAGVDVREALGRLRGSLKDVQDQGVAAAAEVDALAAQVAEREKELAALRAQLSTGRDELLAVERQGFEAGQDESFAAYREKFLALSDRLQKLDAEEHLLDLGGLRNAKWTGDDPQTAEVEGQAVAGLGELKWRLEVAQEKARRLTEAAKSLQEHMTFVEKTGEFAKQDQGRYAGLQAELDTAQKELLPQLLAKAKSISVNQDAQALQAAREAVSAFTKTQQAADKWVSAARELQSTKDKEGRNPRLKTIVGDKSISQTGTSAQAAALMLVGRICAEQLEASEALVRDLQLFADLRPGSEFQAAAFEAEIKTARDNAREAAKKAKDLYEKLAKSAPAAVKWIPQLGLAGALNLLARVSPEESTVLLADALKAAEEATKGREQSPYLQDLLPFRDYLRAKAGQGSGQPETGTPAAGSTDSGGGG